MVIAAYQSFASASSTVGTPITVTKPTGTVSGSGLVAWVLNFNPGSAITPPSGWTLKAGSSTTDAIYEKTAGGSEPASYAWTNNLFNGGNVLIFRVSDQAAAPFVEAQTITNYAVVNTSVVLAALTSSGPNRLLFSGILSGSNNTWTPPGTSTERFDSLDAANFARAGGDEIVGAGSTGTRTWTPNSQAFAAGFMVAIKSLNQDYTESANLVGDGVTSRVVEAGIIEPLTGDGVTTRGSFPITMSDDLTGDGVVTRQFAATMSDDLTGDGVVSRALAVGMSEDVTGDGTVTEAHQQAFTRVFDLVGDGVLTSAKATVASKSFDLVGDGTVTETHSAGMFRTFDLTGDGVISGSADIPFPNIPECAPDWTPNDGLKSIEGDVFFHEPPNEGDPVIGADVCLIRDSDGLRVECTTTDGTGHYSFARDTNDPYTYHVEVRYLDQQGLSEGGCVPA